MRCGKKLSVFLLLLVLILPLPSAELQESSSPLDELLAILTSYEQITQSLENRLIDSENNLILLKTSTSQIKSNIKILEQNSIILTESLNEQQKILTQSVGTLDSSMKRIDGLEIGYKSMERKLKAYKVLSNVLIGVVGVVGVSVVLMLAN